MTIDTLTVLKASGEETSGTDGAGTALDLGGPWGLVYAVVEVTDVKGNPASKLDLVLEGSHDNSNWFTVAKVPQFTTAATYYVPLNGVAAVDALTSTPAVTFRREPRYMRKNSTVTAGTGGDGVTYSIHLTA